MERSGAIEIILDTIELQSFKENGPLIMNDVLEISSLRMIKIPLTEFSQFIQ